MSLVPARHNFNIYQGATFYKRIFFEVEGVPVDLEEHKVSLTIKDEPGGKILVYMDSEPNNGIVLGGVNGTIDLTLAATETKSLEWTSGVYELLDTDEGLTPARTDVIMRGGFKVIPF